MEYFDVIAKRFSVRSYRPDRVDPEKLQKILEAAGQAPTACNLQAFRIVVMKTEGNREALKKVYGRDWFSEAPYVLAVCSIPEKSWVRSDGRNYSDVDAAIIMDHIILAATALGLGTCWIGAFNPQAAREVFRLDENLNPVVLTPLGYPDETRTEKRRKPISDLVSYIE
jgi:nitroreductase